MGESVQTWICHVGEAKLTDSPYALKDPVVDDVPLPFVESGESVDWVAYFVGLSGKEPDSDHAFHVDQRVTWSREHLSIDDRTGEIGRAPT